MIRYSEEILSDVRQSNDIVDVISQYVHLKRRGRNFFGLCPFHNEKSPSFSVSPDKQIFHCFGCGVGGNVITFVSKIEGMNFVETVKMLAERANILLPTLDNNGDIQRELLKDKVYKVNEFSAQFYHQNLYNNIQAKVAQQYVKKRELSNETLKAFRIGFSGRFDELYNELKKHGFEDQEILESGLVNKNDKGQFIDRYRNRLMFPICDVRGRVIAFGGRVLDDSKPKYINSPENVVYSKGRHLFGLNVAKKSDIKRLLIVEGYMDVISLHQRGITNVVASLGTALTEQQGWLLRRNTEQIILSFDSDEAGVQAKLRALDVLQNMGCDLRILQMEGAKDPDEFVIKYGNARFRNLIDKAISVIEFKVRILKKDLNLENVNDKIRFLNEIAKLISKVDNTIEKEIYVEKIAWEYKISKEAIYAEVDKLKYKDAKDEKKMLDKAKNVVIHHKVETGEVLEDIVKRENTVISILLTGDLSVFQIIKQNISTEDFKYEVNIKIVKKLYEEFEKGNSNINAIIDCLDQDAQNQITSILAEDYGMDNLEKAIDDVVQKYKEEKLENRRLEILEQMANINDGVQTQKLMMELKDIINAQKKIK